MGDTSKVVLIRGKDPAKMVRMGVNEIGVKVKGRKVVIKPNLITDRPYPVTTPPETVEALIEYFRKSNELVVAEGSGFGDTNKIFEDFGFRSLAERLGARLVDLNRDEFEIVEMRDAYALKKFEFPKTLKDSYLISAAVLKRHSMAGVTLSLKNALGATVGSDKGRFHPRLDECIVDLNLYLRPKLAVIDGRLGLNSELGGRVKEYGVMIFSEDPVAADAIGAKILGLDPLRVRHLKLAQDAGLGFCDLRKIELVELGEGGNSRAPGSA